MIDFNHVIDKFLEREFRPKEVGKYFPSEAGNCLRKSWYSYKHPAPPEPEKRKVFETGRILHDFMVEVFSSEKVPVKLLQAEVPMKMEFPEFTISGRLDDLILVLANGEIILVEVKTTSYLPKEGPQPHHVMQLQFYLHAVGARNGALLYIDKGTLQTKSFPVSHDEKTAEKVIERFRALHKDLKENILPGPEAKQVKEMNWMCNYCEHRERCDKNEA